MTATLFVVVPAAAQVTRSQNSNAPSYGQPANDTGAPPSSGAAQAGASASVANRLAWRNDRLTLTLADGNFTVSPLVRIDGDEVSFFDQNRAGDFKSGTELRRNRYGLRGTFLKDFEYNFTWEFGSRPSTPNTIFEAQVGWNGLGWGTVRVGAFTPQHMPEYAESSYDLLFLERASITNVAASIASGDTREAVGLEARGARWNASFYVSGGTGSARNTAKERGLVGRAVGLVLDRPGVQLQIGFDGAAQFKPGTNNTPEATRFNDYPELRGTTSLRFLDTGSIRADTAYAVGPELEGRAGPVYFEAVYQHVGVDVTGGGSRTFDGWYVQGAVPLLGPPRERVRNTGTWARPKTRGWINPLAGNWGSLEAVARYSTMNLQDGPTHGGRQRVWAVGANWYLSPNLKLQAEYETGRDHLDTGDREFQGVGFRAALSL
ncbi:MAG: hypothetical protein INR62_05555 [Rhodospirillales bacterium]|nr:hypothetical protein [Acetobacter sp.]